MDLRTRSHRTTTTRIVIKDTCFTTTVSGVVAAPDWLDFLIRVWAHSTLDARSSSANSICASSPARELQIIEFCTCRTVGVRPETSYPPRYRASSDKGGPERKMSHLEKSNQPTSFGTGWIEKSNQFSTGWIFILEKSNQFSTGWIFIREKSNQFSRWGARVGARASRRCGFHAGSSRGLPCVSRRGRAR